MFWNQVWLRSSSLHTLTQSYIYLYIYIWRQMRPACLLIPIIGIIISCRSLNRQCLPFRLPSSSNKVKVVPHKFKLKSIWCVFERKTGSPTHSVLICRSELYNWPDYYTFFSAYFQNAILLDWNRSLVYAMHYLKRIITDRALNHFLSFAA